MCVGAGEGGGLALGERPRCTKVVSQHFLAHGPSNTLGHAATLPHIHTHSHMYLHTCKPILIDMTTQPRTYSFTTTGSYKHWWPSCNHKLSMSFSAPDKC